MSVQKTIREIAGLLTDMGLAEAKIEKCQKHVKVHVTGPNGTMKVTTSRTPSDHRTILNLRAMLRKAGRHVGALTA